MIRALLLLALCFGQTFTFVSASSNSYSTSFPATENPISQGSIWTNGGVTGLDWRNVQTTPNKAFAATNVTGYDDDIAVLNSPTIGPQQYAQGVVYRAGGYSPSDSHEIELLLHFSITAHDAHGYEVLWSTQGHIAIVRWNGPVGDYTPLLDNVVVGQAADGDTMRVEITTAGLITVKINGATVGSITDTTYTSGKPGIGFWPVGTAVVGSYGWKSFATGEF